MGRRSGPDAARPGERTGERTGDGFAERTAVVIGASIAGLLTAAALGRAGYAVSVLERDRLPRAAAHRRGVPQDFQAHILLRRGLTVIEELLPGFRAELVARGAVASDAGQMPWMTEHGWLEVRPNGIEILSATRPLIEAVVRDLTVRIAGVEVRSERPVTELRHGADGWTVRTPLGDVAASVVVDAAGRSSRLSGWLPGLGTPPQDQVDARVGYATRLFAENEPVPLRTGVMIISAPAVGTAGLALPVERGGWLVTAAGFGDRRPPREVPGYRRFLAGLRDPAVDDLATLLEPAGDVHVHRQTSNLRRRWEQVRDWPPGLLVVGDALCAFDPVYGQGITVAALQARALASAMARRQPVTRRLQRALSAETEVPWAIATAADLRSPSCEGEPTMAQRASIAWTNRLTVLAAAGNRRVTAALTAVNHLVVPPSALLHPALLLAAAGPLPTARLPRPAVLDELSRTRLRRSPAGRADA